MMEGFWEQWWSEAGVWAPGGEPSRACDGERSARVPAPPAPCLRPCCGDNTSVYTRDLKHVSQAPDIVKMSQESVTWVATRSL
ncbi:unnamed protein product [Pieris macdunnoughi]|uniref:Uncharacterized protein n=1 Tax=Pieris macdunnoughi TaxID=345717 RepID=A0A821M7U6_9NEOP|nr:unnamed protein product [Pieris macdunnoughi]